MLDFLKKVFAYATFRAYPVFRQIFKIHSALKLGIIYILTYCATPFAHLHTPSPLIS
jgi:hypothetical protein